MEMLKIAAEAITKYSHIVSGAGLSIYILAFWEHRCDGTRENGEYHAGGGA